MARENTYKRRLRGSYITSTISISLVLFMIGLIGLLLLNANHLSDYVKENISFNVLLKEGTREIDIIQMQKSLDIKKYVRSTEYITADKAAERLKKELGEDFIGYLGFNPLLPAIEVKMHASYANNDSIALIEKEFMNNPLVNEVVYEKSLIQAVNENIQKISIILLLFSFLLFLIAIALINNTIRLSVYSKRFLIRTMQMVGATKGFIRRPFIFKSMLQGMFSAIIAIALITLIIYIIQNELQDIIVYFEMNLLFLLYIIIINMGMLINMIFTFFAVNKYLNIDEDKLY